MSLPTWFAPLSPPEISNIKILYLAPDLKVNVDAPETRSVYFNEVLAAIKSIGLSVNASQSFQAILNPRNGINYVFSLYNRAPFPNSEIFSALLSQFHHFCFLGGSATARAIAEDKHLTKILARQIGIPTARWELLRAIPHSGVQLEAKPEFPAPYFVKWRHGAGSEYVSPDCIVHNKSDLDTIIHRFFSYGNDVIIEEFLPGTSYTVPVISTGQGPVALPVVETMSDMPGGIVTHAQARYVSGGIERKLSCHFSRNKLLQSYAIEIFEALDPCDYIRVDFKCDDEKNGGAPYLLEVNICANISQRSAIMQSAKSVGLTQSNLISHVIANGWRNRTFCRIE